MEKHQQPGRRVKRPTSLVAPDFQVLMRISDLTVIAGEARPSTLARAQSLHARRRGAHARSQPVHGWVLRERAIVRSRASLHWRPERSIWPRGRERSCMNAASPGVLTKFVPDRYYQDEDAYMDALANALKEE